MLHKAGRMYSRRIKDATLVEELAILNGDEPTIGEIIGSAVLCGSNNAEDWFDFYGLEEEDDPSKENPMKLAEEIYEIEHADWATRKQWILEEKKWWSIGKDVCLKESNDRLAWHLWVHLSYTNASYLKIVPKAGLSKRQITTVLKAQPWNYI